MRRPPLPTTGGAGWAEAGTNRPAGSRTAPKAAGAAVRALTTRLHSAIDPPMHSSTGLRSRPTASLVRAIRGGSLPAAPLCRWPAVATGCLLTASGGRRQCWHACWHIPIAGGNGANAAAEHWQAQQAPAHHRRPFAQLVDVCWRRRRSSRRSRRLRHGPCVPLRLLHKSCRRSAPSQSSPTPTPPLATQFRILELLGV